MPLMRIPAEEATRVLKGNPMGRWPKRGQPGRLSPLAKPGFSPGFRLTPGEAVFTIGSCFARNVERELGERGFRLPALDVLKADETFASVGSRVLNNYGVASICNELTWALSEAPPEEALFAPCGDGWIDLHLNSAIRPAPLEVVRLRRKAIRAAYRSISDCHAVILTLGLSEVWFDTATGHYLNTAPRRSLMRATPDRFELHVLSFEETRDTLARAVDLLQHHGREDLNIVLTVSPVPLTATYRDRDVMVANCYSKSVLRAAVEEIIHTRGGVDYFPSFESITLSERASAYEDDEIHVSPEVVALNIGRMVAAYTGAEVETGAEDLLAEIAPFRNAPKRVFAALSARPGLQQDPAIADALAEAAVGSATFKPQRRPWSTPAMAPAFAAPFSTRPGADRTPRLQTFRARRLMPGSGPAPSGFASAASARLIVLPTPRRRWRNGATNAPSPRPPGPSLPRPWPSAAIPLPRSPIPPPWPCPEMLRPCGSKPPNTSCPSASPPPRAPCSTRSTAPLRPNWRGARPSWRPDNLTTGEPPNRPL